MPRVVFQPPQASPAHEPLLDAETTRLVRHKTRQLIGKFGFTPSDRDDIQQELILALLKRQAKFDPAKSKKLTFVFRVLANKLTEIVRHRNREKRDRGVVSMDRRVFDNDGRQVKTVDTLATSVRENRIGTVVPSDQERLELQLDVATVISKLPAPQRDLCRRLQRSSFSEICRALNISRRTLDGRLAELREKFVSEGLRPLPVSFCTRSPTYRHGPA